MYTVLRSDIINKHKFNDENKKYRTDNDKYKEN